MTKDTAEFQKKLALGDKGFCAMPYTLNSKTLNPTSSHLAPAFSTGVGGWEVSSLTSTKAGQPLNPTSV